MLPSVRIVVLALCSTAAAACGFDSNGLATGSNSAGTLESTGGGGSSEGDDNPGTTAMPTTSPTGSSTQGNTSDEGSSTMPPSTTGPDDSSSGDSGTTVATASEESTSSDSSDGNAESSSSSGEIEIPSVYYANCTFANQEESCGPEPSYCQAFALEDKTTGHVCYVDCELGPCPDPATGDAVAECNGSGFCVLDCEGDLTCPDGMLCDYSMSFLGYRCVWPA